MSFATFLLLPIKLNAHEMWLEPLHFSLNTGDTIYVHEKVGQTFKGNEYAYLESSYKTLNITVNDKTRSVNSRLGDIPAIKELATEEGLVIFSAITNDSDLSYDKREKFESFIKNEGLDWVLTEHEKRKLPETGFTEIYSRNPKALIKVGHGKGSDKLLGLPLEWLVETNPYTDDKNSAIKARLFWQGKPASNMSVNVFNKANNDTHTDDIIKISLITDKHGRIHVPRTKGLFLINAVKMIEPSAEKAKKSGAVWESIWGSVTYKIE